ncbi:MAG: DUF4144 family protein [Halopseudomonas sp.]
MGAWPAILKHLGENELTFISSQSEWDCDADLHFFSYEPEDVLIDTNGQIHSLTDRQNNFVQPRENGNKIELEVLNALVKEHASQLGSCCVSKISYPSISDAIKAVEAIGE